MRLRGLTADAVDQLSRAKSLAEGHAILQHTVSSFDLDHFAYLAVPRTGSLRDRPTVATTYPDAWQRHYVAQRFMTLDPVVAAGASGVVPFDWSGLDKTGPGLREFFGAAGEHGLGAHGLTFPFRGFGGGFGMLSLNRGGAVRGWYKLRRILIDEFMPLSYFFNAWALSLADASLKSRVLTLSERERECLRWCAAGKTIWDISAILGVSERTVRFHLNNARTKLGAATTTQAVAQAIHCGAIDLP